MNRGQGSADIMPDCFLRYDLISFRLQRTKMLSAIALIRGEVY